MDEDADLVINVDDFMGGDEDAYDTASNFEARVASTLRAPSIPAMRSPADRVTSRTSATSVSSRRSPEPPQPSSLNSGSGRVTPGSRSPVSAAAGGVSSFTPVTPQGENGSARAATGTPISISSSAKVSVGVFCTLCFAEMPNRMDLLCHVADCHPSMADSAEGIDASSVQERRANALGVSRRMTSQFSDLRQRRRTWVDLSTDALPAMTSSLLMNLTALVYGGPLAEGAERRSFEQTIVKWQSDGKAASCAVCSRKAFTFGMLGKHHCRLCGFVICSDCSQFLKTEHVHVVLDSLSSIFKVGLGLVVTAVTKEQLNAHPLPSTPSPSAAGASAPSTPSKNGPTTSAAPTPSRTKSPASARSFDEVYVPRIPSLRCCTNCRVIVEDAQKVVGAHRNHAHARKKDADTTWGISAVSLEVTRVFRAIDRVLPRYNNLANLLWAGEALSLYDEASRMLADIESAANQLEDWTKIATDSIRFAPREVESRLATALLERIDSVSVRQQAIALPPSEQIRTALEARTKTFANGDLGPDHAVVWENQRRWPGTGYSTECLFTADPDPFTPTASTTGVRDIDAVQPKPGMDWASDSEWLISSTSSCDEDGWQYATSFDTSFSPTSDFLLHFVRRRMWCRLQVKPAPASPSPTPVDTHEMTRGFLSPGDPSPSLKDPSEVSPEGKDYPAPWHNNRDSKVCECCRVTQFTFFERKHHCRHCGRVVCSKCSAHRTEHPWYHGNVRTCDGCMKSIARRQSLNVAHAEQLASPSRTSSRPPGVTVPVAIYECERWQDGHGWSAKNLDPGEAAWQLGEGGGGFASLEAFENALCGDLRARIAPPTLAYHTAADASLVAVDWAEPKWSGNGDNNWEYAQSFGRDGSAVEWVRPSDHAEAILLASHVESRQLRVRRRRWARAAKSTAATKMASEPQAGSARMQSYLLRKVKAGVRHGTDAHQWEKGWYVLQSDAIRGYDSEDYTIVRWRVFTTAFEGAKAVHPSIPGEPSQVLLETSVGDDVCFATSTPTLADSWALALQCAISTPMMKGNLYHRVRGSKKAWEARYFELRGKAIVFWDKQGDKLQKGTWSLAFMTSIKRSQDATSMHLTLTDPKGRTDLHELRAETSIIIEEWILAIGTSMATVYENGKGF
eukprot:m.110866 g.110866  ORF g.110866 m.110866 type:complete len:1136 (+) comp10733_c0_seq1:135-3542(+)